MAFDQIKVELCSHWGGDRDAANTAWASSMDASKLADKAPDDVMRVVTGIVHNHHDTPKERLWLEFFITCPIWVERQYDKYRLTLQYQDFEVSWNETAFGRDGITQNELSGRYRTIPERPFTMPVDVAKLCDRAGLKDIATEFDTHVAAQHEWYQSALTRLKTEQAANRITNAEYKRAREVIRGILGTAYLTDMRIVLNMNAFEHIVNQRLAVDAQLESRVVAYLMVQRVTKAKVCPMMLDQMVVANGWDKLLAEVETAIVFDRADIASIVDTESKLD